MNSKKWSWLTEKELDCLLNIDEANQNNVILDLAKDESKSIRREVMVNPKFKLPKGKIIILVSYKDVKRVFKTTSALKEHFFNNHFLRNTERNDDGEVWIKKRSRFFVVPANFSKSCMQLLDKIADPDSGIDDINKLKDDLVKKRENKNRGEVVEKEIVKELEETDENTE